MTVDYPKYGGPWEGASTPVGTITLCITCHTAIIVKRFKGPGYDYNAWCHFVKPIACHHDPKRARSIRERLSDERNR